MKPAMAREPDRGDLPDGARATQAGNSRRRIAWLVAAIVVPLLAGLLWNRASDNPLWPVFRSSLNLCTLSEAQLSPVSPDGRYRVHVVQATCAGRFPETMVFLTDNQEAFPVASADPNRAILEVAGHRTLDAAVWIPAAESPSGKMTLQLWMLKRSMPQQLHRRENIWRDVPITYDNSKPAAGAEKLDY
jgi:hypothetical protein